MKIRPLSREEVRNIDRIAMQEFGIAGLVLMENAGRGAAQWIISQYPPGDVCILCGKGNNGGDGYVIARHLETAELALDRLGPPSPHTNAAWRVRIVSLVDSGELSGDAETNHTIARRAGIPIATAVDRQSLESLVGTPDVLVDCLLGTGATGPPRGLYAEAIRLANRIQVIRIAIDVPTGLDCDTGIASDPTFMATATLTFVAPKVGFSHKEATDYLGQIVPFGIGVPKKLLSQYLVEG